MNRPPMTFKTAWTLRKAHAIARNYRLMGAVMPEGIALLDRDYVAWRQRVQRGVQLDTLLPKGWAPNDAQGWGHGQMGKRWGDPMGCVENAVHPSQNRVQGVL